MYSTGVGSRGSHLERIKSGLQEMAILARSLEEVIQSKFKSSVDTLPKGTIHAVLAFHHVIFSKSDNILEPVFDFPVSAPS